MIGEIYKRKSQVSAYQPSKEVSDLTALVKREFSYGHEILHKSWEELNYYSVIERDNKDKRTFNSFVDESVDDPNEAWKWRGTRSMARNRAMAMHAHLTASYVIPMVFAQNDKQEEDREMGSIMRDIMEWMSVNSEYRSSFLKAVMGMLTNSVTFLGAEYCEVFQTIKEKGEGGQITKKEILDEVLSGFQPPVYSAEQILITNAYEQNIQKQRSIIKRRYVEYSELEAKYGDHPNWDYLNPGVKSIYNDEEGTFYDIRDQDHPYQVEEAIWENRRQDGQVPFLNGIYFGDDDIEANPIKHRDNRGAPKYNVTPFGYERINEHFFYYKSLMNRVGWDDQLLDAMYQVTMNMAFKDLEMPIVVSGSDKVDSSISFPGAVTAFQNPDTKVTPLLPRSNISAGFQALQKVEDSISEASMSEMQTGNLPEASQKATAINSANMHAKVILQGVGKTLGLAVAQYGDLMIDIAVNHLTTAQLDEITGDMNYRPFILNDQMVDGKKVSKSIRFDEALIGKDMSPEQKDDYNLHLLTKTGYPDNKEHLYLVNPHLFSKMKYLCRVEPEMMEEKNQQFEQAVSMELYQILSQNPLIEQEAMTRDLLNAFRKDPDKLISKAPQTPGQPMIAAPASQMAQQAKQKNISTALSGAGAV